MLNIKPVDINQSIRNVDISIPLHEGSLDDLKLPISLNYELKLHASLSTLNQTEAGTKSAPLDYNSWNMGDSFT